MGLVVEKHGGCARSRCCQGIALERRKVRSSKNKGMLDQQFVKKSLGKGSALGRIRARAEFVEKNEASPIQMLPGFGKVIDLGREGGDIGLKALLVAYEGVYPLQKGQMRGRPCRHWQACEDHGCAKTQGLQADGLAAGVAATHHKNPVPGTEDNVQGTYTVHALRVDAPFWDAPGSQGVLFCKKQERMARLGEAYALGNVSQLNHAAFHCLCQALLCLQEVEFCEQIDGSLGPVKALFEHVAKEEQDLALLLALLALQFLHAVVELNEEHGLEIAGFACLGPVVYDALQLVLVGGLEGEHVAVRGECHELVLQIAQDVVLFGKGAHPAQDCLVYAPDFRTNLEELRGGLVADVAVVPKTAHKRVVQGLGQGRIGGKCHEAGPGFLAFGHTDGVPKLHCKAKHCAQGPEGIAVQIGPDSTPLGHGLQEPGHIRKIPEGKGNLAVCGKCQALVVEALGLKDIRLAVEGEQVQGPLPACVGLAESGQTLQYAVKLQGVEGAFVNHCLYLELSLQGSEARFHCGRKLSAVNAALVGLHERSHDLAHIGRPLGAHLCNGFLDDCGKLFVGKSLGKIGFEHCKLVRFLRCQIFPCCLLVFGNGVAALLGFLDDDVQHFLVGKLAAGTAQFHKTVLDGGFQHAQDRDLQALPGLVGANVVRFDLFSESHILFLLISCRFLAAP